MPPRRSTHRSPARFLGRVVEGAKPAPSPGFVEPCAPTARKHPPSGEGGLHEIKHDGYRLQAQFSDGVRIFPRWGHDWATRNRRERQHDGRVVAWCYVYYQADGITLVDQSQRMTSASSEYFSPSAFSEPTAVKVLPTLQSENIKSDPV